MVDFSTALSLVREKFLPSYEDDYGSPAVLLEAETEEREWGWIFHCRIKNPSLIPEGKSLRAEQQVILIDREYGRVHFATLAGLELGIQRLLGYRDRTH